MKASGWRAWLVPVVILEIAVVLIALSAMGKRTTAPGEANKIARLVLEDPTALESFLFYFALGHVVIGVLLLVAWTSARLKAARRGGSAARRPGGRK